MKLITESLKVGKKHHLVAYEKRTVLVINNFKENKDELRVINLPFLMVNKNKALPNWVGQWKFKNSRL